MFNSSSPDQPKYESIPVYDHLARTAMPHSIVKAPNGDMLLRIKYMSDSEEEPVKKIPNFYIGKTMN